VTYSIVARDPDTGALGVGVQTCWFAVGALVPWAIPGVGAVATQAMVDVAYGPRCLDRLLAGDDATAALGRVRTEDDGSALRQVGVVDGAGNTAAFTGELCIDHAGDRQGRQFTVQANMMASPAVWPAMADAFQAATGRLAERILASLRAGEAAGGDARGAMSAALLVVDGGRHDHPWEGTLVNVRVDHHERPLDELERLLGVADAFDHCDRAEGKLFGGHPADALKEIEMALARLPGDENARLLKAGALILSGHHDAGVDELRSLVAARPSWSVVVRGFVAKGLLPVPDGMDVDAILGP
jgi:uncharacterized Ntn-hydrolase superfamily protein